MKFEYDARAFTFDKDTILAAEVEDPASLPVGALRIFWLRPSFEQKARPVCVDARLLPDQEEAVQAWSADMKRQNLLADDLAELAALEKLGERARIKDLVTREVARTVKRSAFVIREAILKEVFETLRSRHIL